MAPGFFLKEAAHGLTRSFSAALLAAFAVLMAALALSVFIPIFPNGGPDDLGVTATEGLLAGGGAVLLALASVAFIAYTIRLSIHARRREVEVMRLVGATSWYIRWPFVIEGAIVGLVGGAVAIGLLALAKETFMDPLAGHFALAGAPDTISFPLLVALLLAACAALSAIGTGIVLRRFVPA